MAPQKTVLITGCSDGGIGHGLAVVFQQRGYHVFATTRNPATMSKLKDLPNVTLLKLDVRDKADIKAAVEAVTSQSGGTLDYLVNNAGLGHYMPILDLDLDDAQRLFAINVWGPVAIVQAFAPLLIKSQGTVAFITSVAGYLNVPYLGTYAASKRSLEIIAETLRLELEPFHVRVLSVVTGAVQSMGQSKVPALKLPENSIYKPIEDTIAAAARGEGGPQRVDLLDYSKKVVTEITKGRSGKFWCGWGAGFTNFASSHLPSFIMDKAVTKSMGLGVLAAKNKS